jgi:3-methyl-2-oxobutanoate hydroxymethyltransferase
VGSYEHDDAAAYKNAQWLIKSGAHMVKFEGGDAHGCNTARYLVERGIPVCAHLGLHPAVGESALGGYKIQGKTEASAHRDSARQAIAMSEAGASFVYCWKWCQRHWPSTSPKPSAPPPSASVPGVDCSAQVLVLA